MGKTRDILKKTGDIKGIFYARMGTIKDRNGMDFAGGKNTHNYTKRSSRPR